MAKILFVHNNFPGQFGFLAEALARKGHRCVAIASPTGRAIPGVTLLRWQNRRGSTPGIFALATRAEADLIRARAAAGCALRLRDKGFNPDLIVGHPGWGETILLKEIFPRAKQILHGEFYYASEGGDAGFDHEFSGPLSVEDRFRLHAKGATMALAYTEADRIVCPTPFQANRFPDIFQSRISIIHEGINTDAIRPDANAILPLPSGRMLNSEAPVITFINRRFEPLRGFHIFMRALPKILSELPEANAVLIGSEAPGGYGVQPPKGTTWKAKILAEVEAHLDLSRVHFLGLVPHHTMLSALSVSTAHVYYTYPFVLSWSLLEAMATECLIIASDTPPVRDAVEHNVNGMLLDFFNVAGLADACIAACRDREPFRGMRTAARQTVLARFDQNRSCGPAWLKLVAETLGKRA